MKINHFLDIYKIKPEELSKFTSRREAFLQLGSLGKKLAMAAIPFGVATVSSNKVFAQGSTSIVDVLNFALTLEYLEAQFYIEGLDANGLIPGGRERKIFEQIKEHEVDHVEFLRSVINSLGEDPVEKPTFDFTAGGLFMPFEDYEQFKALSQAFEDTGVRAYKGQAANLMENNDILTAALQIHSVEARHASEVRRLRGLKGWITQDERGMGIPEAAQAVYAGEDQVIQLGVDVREVTPVGEDGITEAFDEPLTMQEVLAIAGLFIV